MSVQNSGYRHSSGVVARRVEAGETCLYRFFAADGQLLYVGISDEPMRRWHNHTDREWWSYVETYEVVWYPTREDAELAERDEIIGRNPVHNIVLNSVPYAGRRFPSMHLHAMAVEHFGDRAFTCHDLLDELGMPYGTAKAYARRLVELGQFRDAGCQPRSGKGKKRQLYVAVPRASVAV